MVSEVNSLQRIVSHGKMVAQQVRQIKRVIYPKTRLITTASSRGSE